MKQMSRQKASRIFCRLLIWQELLFGTALWEKFQITKWKWQKARMEAENWRKDWLRVVPIRLSGEEIRLDFWKKPVFWINSPVCPKTDVFFQPAAAPCLVFSPVKNSPAWRL